MRANANLIRNCDRTVRCVESRVCRSRTFPRSVCFSSCSKRRSFSAFTKRYSARVRNDKQASKQASRYAVLSLSLSLSCYYLLEDLKVGLLSLAVRQIRWHGLGAGEIKGSELQIVGLVVLFVSLLVGAGRRRGTSLRLLENLGDLRLGGAVVFLVVVQVLVVVVLRAATIVAVVVVVVVAAWCFLVSFVLLFLAVFTREPSR